jgi:hypothetical protein
MIANKIARNKQTPRAVVRFSATHFVCSVIIYEFICFIAWSLDGASKRVAGW